MPLPLASLSCCVLNRLTGVVHFNRSTINRLKVFYLYRDRGSTTHNTYVCVQLSEFNSTHSRHLTSEEAPFLSEPRPKLVAVGGGELDGGRHDRHQHWQRVPHDPLLSVPALSLPPTSASEHAQVLPDGLDQHLFADYFD